MFSAAVCPPYAVNSDRHDHITDSAFECPSVAPPALFSLVVPLQSGGTRGDVQPATALGVALAGLGAHVCVAADAMFGGFVQQQRLAYRQLAGDARGMMALTVKWG